MVVDDRQGSQAEVVGFIFEGNVLPVWMQRCTHTKPYLGLYRLAAASVACRRVACKQA